MHCISLKSLNLLLRRYEVHIYKYALHIFFRCHGILLKTLKSVILTKDAQGVILTKDTPPKYMQIQSQKHVVILRKDMQCISTDIHCISPQMSIQTFQRYAVHIYRYVLHIFFSHPKDDQGVQLQGSRWRSRMVPSFA